MDTGGGWEPRDRLPESGMEGTWGDISFVLQPLGKI